MMQNNPMGAMMPQGVAPAASTGLNFQSDPSMRAQFKGFMSGMQAKQPAPAAPMAPMMQQPLPMPPSMQNIDIFQPSMPMRMAMGGSVPRNTQIAGQPHMLSYITPGEAGVLRAIGGAGRPGPGGIPSFFFDTAEFGVSGGGYSDPYESGTGTSNFSSGSSYDVATSSDDNNYSYNDPYESSFSYGTDTYTPPSTPPSSDNDDYYTASQNPPPPPSTDTVNFSTTSVPGGTSDGSDPVMDALSRALQNTAAENQAQRDRERADANLGARFDQIQGQSPTGVGSGPTAVGGMPETLDFSRNVIDAIDFEDILGENAQNNLLDVSFDPNLEFGEFDTTSTVTGPTSRPSDFSMQGPPQFIETDRRGGIRTFDPSNPNVSVEAISGTVDYPGTVFDRDVDNFLAAQGTTMSPSQFQAAQDFKREQDLLNSIGVEEANPAAFGRGDRQAPELGFGLGGMGAEGEAVPPPGASLDEVQAAIDLARGQGGDSTIIQSEIGRLSDLMNRQTTVTGGDKKNIPGRVDPNTGLPINVDARSVSSLEQLGRRAGRGSEGVSGFIERFTGFNPAASMYEDIVNNNYSPIYDNRGQIIGTINPETGQLGKGSRPIDTGAISSTDSDLPAFRYNQFADRNLAGGGGGDAQSSSPPPVFNPPDPVDDSGEGTPPMIDPDRPDTGGGTQQPVVKLPPAQVGNPLRFGYGRFNLSPNLNSAADDFLRLLGGR